MITVLSGGVGAARLLRALREATDDPVRAIVNVGDDLVLHGLTICPDLDTITYTLAGLNNEELGWGLRGETWRVRDELAAIGGAAWFSLGDRDLATHLYRTQRISEGATKTLVAAELATTFGVDVTLLPVTDDEWRTEFVTEIGRLSFQEYFVKHRHSVRVTDIEFVGAATVSPAASDALTSATRIVVAPSNPLISLRPIVAVPGVLDLLAPRRRDVVAVSPIVGGRAIKGPADRLLHEFGYDVSPVGVAQFVVDHGDFVGRWIIDVTDAPYIDALSALGCEVTTAPTIMSEPGVNALLAAAVLS